MIQIVRVIEIGTGDIVREIDVTGKGDTHVEYLIRGLLKQMDTDKFYVDDSRAFASENKRPVD